MREQRTRREGGPQRGADRRRDRRQGLALAALLATLAVALWATALVAPSSPTRGGARLSVTPDAAAAVARPEPPPRDAAPGAHRGVALAATPSGGNAPRAPRPTAATVAPAAAAPPRDAPCAADGPGCDDRNPCTLSACDPETGACLSQPVPDGRACPGDGDGCTTDVCVGGRCVHRRDLRGGPCADDGDPCTADRCVAGRCTHEPACRDLDACHTAACDAATGDCVQVRRACDDGDPCTAGACDPATGACAWSPIPDCPDGASTPWEEPYA